MCFSFVPLILGGIFQAVIFHFYMLNNKAPHMSMAQRFHVIDDNMDSNSPKKIYKFFFLFVSSSLVARNSPLK